MVRLHRSKATGFNDACRHSRMLKPPFNLTLQATSLVDKLAGLSWQYGENILRLRDSAGLASGNFLTNGHHAPQKYRSLLGITPQESFFTCIGK